MLKNILIVQVFFFCLPLTAHAAFVLGRLEDEKDIPMSCTRLLYQCDESFDARADRKSSPIFEKGSCSGYFQSFIDNFKNQPFPGHSSNCFSAEEVVMTPHYWGQAIATYVPRFVDWANNRDLRGLTAQQCLIKFFEQTVFLCAPSDRFDNECIKELGIHYSAKALNFCAYKKYQIWRRDNLIESK